MLRRYKMEHLEIEYLPIDRLTPYERNAKEHPQEQIDQIKESIRLFGMNDPIGIWGDECLVVEGHGRLIALQQMGEREAPTIRLDHMTDAQRRAYTLAHNKTTMNSGFDIDVLNSEIAALEYDFDMEALGFESMDELKQQAIENAYDIPDSEKASLSDTFVVPPFTILDSRSGEWNERKRIWHSLIKDNAEARADAEVFDGGLPGFERGVSLLDPVMAEIVTRWFAPGAGKCFDVFAGDTVFGYVSSYLGNEFTGIELREEQAEFNNNSVGRSGLNARYICDDGRNVLQHLEPESQDLFFSCPPYFDLEVYSDKPNDASNQKTFAEFYAILDTAFTNAIKCLKNNRFAVVVCGDVRDRKTGFYYNFNDEIKQTFIRNGMGLYNELILINPYGTAALRANKYMRGRKCAKVHQNVLVFYKGDTQAIKNEFPILTEMEALADESDDE